MKNWIAAIAALGFIAALAFAPAQPKTYKVELTLDQWSARVNQLEYVKQQIRQSDLPSKQVALITDSVLIPLQAEISQQIQKQIADEKAAQLKKDTTKPKK